MTAYALAHLRTPTVNEDVLRYMDLVQDTMDPYGGRFLVHGGDVEVKEGSWPGTVVVLEFPDMTAARAWYDSAAYREILPLRVDNVAGDAILVDGVGAAYHPRATAAALRDSAPPA